MNKKASTKAKSIEGSTILVVEDEPSARNLLVDVLESFKAKTIVAETGEEAQDLVKGKALDIMLLDIDLGPGISGLQLAYNLKLEKLYKDTPVVAVTGISDEKLESLKDMGFDACLAKPYEVAQLQLLLEYYLSGSKGSKEPPTGEYIYIL